MSDYGSFPLRRMRRLRSTSFVRTLRREHELLASDLIYPVFFVDSESASDDIPSMPGIKRLGRRQLVETAERCLDLGIAGLALFPVIEPSLKTLDGQEAYNAQGLVPRTLQLLKKQFPQLGLIADIALDPYTSHGHDGLVDADGQVLNDETVAVLRRQALCYAKIGRAHV